MISAPAAMLLTASAAIATIVKPIAATALPANSSARPRERVRTVAQVP
jgi:hypothetical protein